MATVAIYFQSTVKIHKGHQTLAVLKDRDFFGELSLLDTETRSAGVITTSPCTVLKLDQEPFYELLEIQ